jgi:hypothetical protein
MVNMDDSYVQIIIICTNIVINKMNCSSLLFDYYNLINQQNQLLQSQQFNTAMFQNNNKNLQQKIKEIKTIPPNDFVKNQCVFNQEQITKLQTKFKNIEHSLKNYSQKQNKNIDRYLYLLALGSTTILQQIVTNSNK